MEKRLIWVFLFVFIDILGFSLIIPLLPYIGREFSASPSLMGFLLTSNAIAQMITTPWIGSLSDTYGRRPLLLLCIAGTCVSFLILANATTIFELFLSRIIDGLLGGNISLAQAYISDVTETKDRSKGFGMIGAAFGLAFIFGPAIGGTLSSQGFRIPALCSALISLFNLIGVYFFLPESKSFSSGQEEQDKHKPMDEYYAPVRLVKLLFTKSPDAIVNRVKVLMVLRFFQSFCFTLWETSFAFYNLQVLQIAARPSSYLLAYFGVIFSLVQGGAVRMKSIQANEGKVTIVSLFVCGASLFMWSFTTSVNSTMFALFPLGFSCGLLNTLINSQISKHVNKSQIGGALGVSASIGSLTRVMAPLSSGLLIDQFGVSSPGIIGGAIVITMGYFATASKIDSNLGLEQQSNNSSVAASKPKAQ